MNEEASYTVCYDRLPPKHSLHGEGAYQTYLKDRTAQSVELQRHPLPPGSFGLIVEANTSAHWTMRRPQIVLGTVESRAMFRLQKGYRLEDGLGGLAVVRAAVFVPSSRTVYGDTALDIAIRPLGRMTWGFRSTHRSEPAHDPMRLHQHRSRRRHSVRRDPVAGEGQGITFTTLGEPLAETTHCGIPLWTHMLVRIIGKKEDFAHAIALSFIGRKTLFFPDEARSKVGVCHKILFRPGIQEEGRQENP
ncbi:hypothetical protein KSF_106750 [Reticulibacter mediterranei]|uniref:Uncharacterized protein n=1 Tax=Reticulibacter mediterranei TaxID=2778369 RepID=A0A8J3N6R2_9CHLR|nr:hypothetical protein [Reticulibacter mediterranei]GHP00628.1 hypothetical protein KSF_106750 [Reticulibacter mediterranei]